MIIFFLIFSKGNVPEHINLRSTEDMKEFHSNSSLFDLMLKEMKAGSLMSCSIKTPSERTPGRDTEMGMHVLHIIHSDL